MSAEEEPATDLLTAAEVHRRINLWFEEREVDLTCAACGLSEWRPSTCAAAWWVNPSGTPVIIDGAPMHYMFLPLICKHCAFVVFFNAGPVLGLDHPDYFPKADPSPLNEEGAGLM